MSSSVVFVLLLAAFGVEAREFVFGFDFNDDVDSQRVLTIDISSPTTFLLDAKRFADEAGIGNTFYTETAKKFKRLSSYYGANYKSGKRNAKVTGILGEDGVLIVGKTPVNATFAVAYKIEGDFNPAKDTKDLWTAGRMGLARSNDKTNLGSELLKVAPYKVFCGQAWLGKDGVEAMTVIGGDPRTTPTYSIAKVVPKERTLWKVPLSRFTLDGQTYDLEQTVTISTTIDSLLVPPQYLGPIMAALNAKKVGDGYTIDCEKTYNLSFTTNGSAVPINFPTLLRKEGDNCFLKIEANGENSFVFGIPFFVNNLICLYYERDEVVFHHPHEIPNDAQSSFRIANYRTTPKFMINS